MKTNGIRRAQQNSEALAIEGPMALLEPSPFSHCSVLSHLKLEFLVFVSMNCLTIHVCEESKNANEAPENA